MYINGMSNTNDVINMIKDTIDEGNLESAKEYLEQLKEELTVKEVAKAITIDGLPNVSSFMKNYQESGAGYDDTKEGVF